MRAWILVVAGVSLAALASGCGDDGGEADDDVVVVPDAGPDAAVPGAVEDFGACQDDGDCKNAGSECRLVGWTNQKECLPACSSTSECGFNTYCYPANSGSALGPTFAAMAGHCWFSICGPGRQNGQTGGACQLGKEAGVAAAQQLPGYCLAIEDGLFGQCLEVGDVAPGGTCDLATLTRGGKNCDAAGLCVGSQGAAQGTCAQVCDPRKILTGGDDCANPAEDCLDQSSVNTYADGSTARSTVGFCSDVQACATVGPNTCPTGEGCAFTNPLRPTGVCDPAASGSLALGATCPGSGSGDAAECVAGTACLGTCVAVCDFPAPRPGQLGGSCTGDADCTQLANTCDEGVCVQACGGVGDPKCPEPTVCDGGTCKRTATPTVSCGGVAAGTTCQPVRWEAGADKQPNTADDVYAADWGICDAT